VPPLMKLKEERFRGNMLASTPEADRARLGRYWEEARIGIVHRLGPIRQRRLDRMRVLENNSCFITGNLLLAEFIELTMVDEDELARTVLETAHFYLATAIDRDELSTYVIAGQEVRGRAERLKSFTLARWLENRSLDLEALRQAVEMKREWSERAFAQKNWRALTLSLCEWMEELILLGEFVKAKNLCDTYYKPGIRRSRTRWTPESVLFSVAAALAEPKDSEKRHEAETAIEKLYLKITDWGAPGFRENDVLHDERFIVAYIRAKYFKGEEDPIQIIKWMKFRV
jgi:hypothetical protein